jgi:hypothetical protein
MKSHRGCARKGANGGYGYDPIGKEVMIRSQLNRILVHGFFEERDFALGTKSPSSRDTASDKFQDGDHFMTPSCEKFDITALGVESQVFLIRFDREGFEIHRLDSSDSESDGRYDHFWFRKNL